MSRWSVELGPAEVSLTSASKAVVQDLACFYRLEPHHGTPTARGLVIEADVGEPNDDMTVNPWGVGYRMTTTSSGPDRLRILGPDPNDVAITVRKAARESLVGLAEIGSYAMIHASAVSNGDKLTIFAGDSGSGKTTHALRAVFDHGAQLVANDHLLIATTDDALQISSLPTPIPLKPRLWVEWAERLPQPWNRNQLDLEDIAGWSSEQLTLEARRAYFSSGQLGMYPRWIAAAKARIVILDPVPIDADVPSRLDLAAASDPAGALWPHVRFDWPFDPVANTNMAGRHRRGKRQYEADAIARINELVACADEVFTTTKSCTSGTGASGKRP